MSLKTDYKNDMYTGKRKYLLIDNGDGTYSIDDVTDYVQDGDVFSADDINATNKAVNQNIQDIADVALDLVNGLREEREYTDQLKVVKYATLAASGWSSSAPYTQTVNVAGIESSDTPVVSLFLPANITSADVKSKAKAFGYLDRVVTGNGTITAYCYNSKPETDFQIAIKGE